MLGVLRTRSQRGWRIKEMAHKKKKIAEQLLQPRVLGFGLLQDGDVGVVVFPERASVLILAQRAIISDGC